jgi:hypothetical protein
MFPGVAHGRYLQGTKNRHEADDRVSKLVQEMAEVYSYVGNETMLSQIMERLDSNVLEITKQTLECAIFLHEYTTNSFAGTGNSPTSFHALTKDRTVDPKHLV